MKRLMLLRHAKAVTDSPGGDHARVLNARGREDAARMGGFLQAKKLTPDHVLCSSAARTMETWQLAAPELGRAPQAEFLDGLYLASWKAIINIIRTAPDTAKNLLVIGHNPGLEECALALEHKPDSKEERARVADLHEKFPTCSLAVFECDITHWRELATGANKLAAFVRPKDLKTG
ncbi:MAG TPA: histidine phosphatase family protein [Rhizomicrobium sp.]|nr:histidine phosphatase family protein [Rhizomicrobium sp.]